jgi:hypothetical protein
MADYQYVSPKQLVQSGNYPFSMGQIRHLLLFRHRNGLQNAVRKVGKRILLRKDLFDAWLENQGREENSA